MNAIYAMQSTRERYVWYVRVEKIVHKSTYRACAFVLAVKVESAVVVEKSAWM